MVRSQSSIMITEQQENYFMDVENFILEKYWKKGIEELKGIKRMNNNEWINLIKEYSDVKLEIYKKWVKSGGGDEWFLED